MRTLLIAAGLLSLALALLGAVLPLLPTTPFLLLAAGCFSRSSTRLHRFLLRLPIAGRILEDHAVRGGLTRRSKRSALMLLWFGIGASAMALAGSVSLLCLLGLVAVSVSALILRLPEVVDG